MWIFKYIIVCQEYSQLFTNLIAEQWNSDLISKLDGLVVYSYKTTQKIHPDRLEVKHITEEVH